MTAPQPPGAPQFERDPYPKMIIAVIVVTVLLFFVVMGLVVYDLATRAQEEPVDTTAPFIPEDNPPPGAPMPENAPVTPRESPPVPDTGG
ncbi:MAG: hypothetical protein ACLFTT_01280 [Candidatus Hydrogenedentota bacterium]